MDRLFPLSRGALAALCALALPHGLAAQQTMVCGQRAAVIEQLHTRFGEERRAMGLAGHNRIVELFVSDRTGSWTITVTGIDGITCLMASGEHHESFAPGEAL
ncbi:hypothetical protein [uncultured Roseicyclus sp.]|jgi:hypothetical protein|uniref:hypothetical protein n=1 Tax=uncultured Roseicyclus sp. TaxID=543072 RepID=UPI0026213B06|nr:hypothetical protein [uncultured Roseicyclus sp.]